MIQMCLLYDIGASNPSGNTIELRSIFQSTEGDWGTAEVRLWKFLWALVENDDCEGLLGQLELCRPELDEGPLVQTPTQERCSSSARLVRCFYRQWSVT